MSDTETNAAAHGRDVALIALMGDELSGADLSNLQLAGIDLSGRDLSSTNFKNTDLQHANFTNSELGGADFAGSDLSFADLTGASVSWIELDGATLEQTQLSEDLLADGIGAGFPCPICGIWLHPVNPRESNEIIWDGGSTDCGHHNSVSNEFYLFRSDGPAGMLVNNDLGAVLELANLADEFDQDVDDENNRAKLEGFSDAVVSAFDDRFQLEVFPIGMSEGYYPFAENPTEAIWQGWIDVRGLAETLTNPFIRDSDGWTEVERLREHIRDVAKTKEAELQQL